MRLFARAVLLELLEQIAKPAAEDAARSAARKQSAQPALQHVANSPTTSNSATGIRRRGRRYLSGCGAWLAAAEMLDRLPGDQREYGHRHRRHSTVRLRRRMPGTERPVLHSVEYVKQTH